jgi:hypothetical protein
MSSLATKPKPSFFNVNAIDFFGHNGENTQP